MSGEVFFFPKRSVLKKSWVLKVMIRKIKNFESLKGLKSVNVFYSVFSKMFENGLIILR